MNKVKAVGGRSHFSTPSRFETYPYTDQLIYLPASTNILV